VHPRPLRRAGLLAHDVAHRRRHLGQPDLGGRALVAAAEPDRIADVELVHPLVEDADLHEPPVGVLAGGREPDGVPRLGRHRSELLLALGDVVAEAGQHDGGWLGGEGVDPRLVELPDVVADMGVRGLGDHEIRCADAEQHRLGADEVGGDGLHVPAGQAGRPLPVVVGQPGEEGVEAGPDVVQGCDGRFLRDDGGHGGSLQGVGFWIVFQLRAVKYGSNVRAISSWSARCLGRWIS
jgi:hypothetical protein